MGQLTRKHRSHLRGKLQCRPFGKYKRKLQKLEEREWIKKEKEWKKIMDTTR
jgi:hypothetical protein